MTCTTQVASVALLLLGCLCFLSQATLPFPDVQALSDHDFYWRIVAPIIRMNSECLLLETRHDVDPGTVARKLVLVNGPMQSPSKEEPAPPSVPHFGIAYYSHESAEIDWTAFPKYMASVCERLTTLDLSANSLDVLRPPFCARGDGVKYPKVYYSRRGPANIEDNFLTGLSDAGCYYLSTSRHGKLPKAKSIRANCRIIIPWIRASKERAVAAASLPFNLKNLYLSLKPAQRTYASQPEQLRAIIDAGSECRIAIAMGRIAAPRERLAPTRK